MLKFDHMSLPVTDCYRSRDWYVGTLGFKIEFEVAETSTVAIQDEAGFTIFLHKTPSSIAGEKCALTIQVDDVDSKYRELVGKGAPFVNSPKRLFWGYGAELSDPDGYLIRLWDETTMRASMNAEGKT